MQYTAFNKTVVTINTGRLVLKKNCFSAWTSMLNMGLINGMFVACGIWCLARTSYSTGDKYIPYQPLLIKPICCHNTCKNRM